jgi:hypothetical protein
MNDSGGGIEPKLLIDAFNFHSPEKFGLSAAATPRTNVIIASANIIGFIGESSGRY